MEVYDHSIQKLMSSQ